MSYIKINITDKNRTISGEIHGATGEYLVAALSAEPETIEELETALARFVRRDSDWSVFQGFAKNENLEPFDAGILVIDLAGRTVAVDSSYASFSANGNVLVRGDFEGEDGNVPYRLPDDWRFVHSIPEYKGLAAERRREHLKNPPFDARAVLFGRPLIEFIVCECAAAKGSDDSEIFTKIHAEWLMTARTDLRGKTPREMLLEKRKLIEWDLHSRSLQWSFTKSCPPALPDDSHAYLYAGFGTHEAVVYYDLVRFLLAACFDDLHGTENFSSAAKIERLSDLKDEWLAAPQPEFSGRKPLDIIETERRRINLTMSAAECLIDDDCPMCVMMSEEFDTPTFWHLDGSIMDYQFEFSFHQTLEEWEKEQREYEEYSRY